MPKGSSIGIAELREALSRLGESPNGSLADLWKRLVSTSLSLRKDAKDREDEIDQYNLGWDVASQGSAFQADSHDAWIEGFKVARYDILETRLIQSEVKIRDLSERIVQDMVSAEDLDRMKADLEASKLDLPKILAMVEESRKENALLRSRIGEAEAQRDQWMSESVKLLSENRDLVELAESSQQRVSFLEASIDENKLQVTSQVNHSRHYRRIVEYVKQSGKGLHLFADIIGESVEVATVLWRVYGGG